MYSLDGSWSQGSMSMALEVARRLWRCSSLQGCVAVLRCSLVSVMLLGWSSLSGVASCGLLGVDCKWGGVGRCGLHGWVWGVVWGGVDLGVFGRLHFILRCFIYC